MKAAKKIVLNWAKQAQENKVPQLMKTAVTIITYRTGIFASPNRPVSTGKVRGTRKI
ncbi:MAG: hypothetical protein HXL27_04195 [Prevotellaceae bacterium]|jgi:hypothetical protein|nr:hypothetical protein [Prevotellaceae bacterium]